MLVDLSPISYLWREAHQCSGDNKCEVNHQYSSTVKEYDINFNIEMNTIPNINVKNNAHTNMMTTHLPHRQGLPNKYKIYENGCYGYTP